MSCPSHKKKKLSFEKVRGVHQKQRHQLERAIQETLNGEGSSPGGGLGGIRVVLVGGSSGTGKTHLVQSTITKSGFIHHDEQQQQPPKAWYGSAKFDQQLTTLTTATPFAAAQKIVTDITIQQILPHQVLVDSCRTALQNEFADTTSSNQIDLLIEMIPQTRPLLQRRQEQTGHTQKEEEEDTTTTTFDRHNNAQGTKGAAAADAEVASKEKNHDDEDSNNNLFKTDHINSTRLALRSFLRAISTVLPLILVIDDIMWSDRDTLEVFKLLLTSTTSTETLASSQEEDKETTTTAAASNVLFCATYRDDEVPLLPPVKIEGENKNTQEQEDTNPFVQWYKEVQETLEEENIQMLSIQNLSVSDIQKFLLDALCLVDDYNNGDTLGLAKLLHSRTDGNVFYLIQTLENLCDLDLIKYDLGCWTFALRDIQMCNSLMLCDNVGQLVCSRISQLDKPVQDVLKLASCFGATVELQALEIAMPQVSFVSNNNNNNNTNNKNPHATITPAIDSLLERACQEMMLIRISENVWKFSHDQIQAAAYEMISSSSYSCSDEMMSSSSESCVANQIHWRIGQSLLHHKATIHNRSLTFACADQLKRGFDCFDYNTSRKEGRVAIAELSLVAGQRAAAISAFLTASDFFKLGIDAMGGPIGSFEERYGLAVKLCSLHARAEQCCGNISESKKAAETILAHAKNQDDKVSAYRTLLSCFYAANKTAELIDFGLELCDKLGEKIPKNPKPRQVRREVEEGRKVLLKTSNAQIMSLPPMQDKNKDLIMSCLNCHCLLILWETTRSTT